MARPSDWPASLPPTLAVKYAGAAATLRKTFRRGELFETALFAAVLECEQAQVYKWPEGKRWNTQAEKIQNWQRSSNTAAKLATLVKAWDVWTTALRLQDAAKQTGVILRSKSNLSGQFALAALLEALSRQKVKKAPKKRPGASSYGPITWSAHNDSRTTWPSKGVVFTVALAHLFQRVKAFAPKDTDWLAHKDLRQLLSRRRHIELNSFSIRSPGRIEKCACWVAASEFAMVAFPEQEGSDLASTAQRWLSNHSNEAIGHYVHWVGWKLSETGKQAVRRIVFRSIKDNR
jgi:hypothetical protein